MVVCLKSFILSCFKPFVKSGAGRSVLVTLDCCKLYVVLFLTDSDLYEESPLEPSDSSKDEEAADFLQIIRAKDKGAIKQVKFLKEPVEGSDGGDVEKKSKKKEKSVKFALEDGGNVAYGEFSGNKLGQNTLTNIDVGTNVLKGKKKKSGKSVGILIEGEGVSDSDNTGVSKLKMVKKGQKVVPESDSEEEIRLDSGDDKGSDEEEREEDSGEEFEDEESGSVQLDSEASDEEEETKPKLKEDIYGRLRDAEGNVYKESEVGRGGGGAYVPPAKRLAMAQGSEKKKIELERLKKQLKGLMNRVSESNMQGICGQIGQLYLHHSRADMNESLTEILMTNCISPVLTPERLGLELAMLVAVLHSNVGIEVGAFFLQQLANKFDERFKLGGNYGDGKEADNILIMIGHLYNFKVVHCLLVFDILRKLTESFQEKDIELIMGLLKNVGFGLRKDDPAALKEVIVQVQTKANTADMEQFKDKSRVKFMLEVLLAIRNNNVRKIPNYDPSHLEHLKKLLRGYIKGSGSTTDSELRISLHDLVNAENKGRWWVVGSAWTGRETDRRETVSSQTSIELPENISMEIMDLAKKQRMNTDVRRTIFCVLMTSEDFVDAFEKLLRLSLKHQQEREIIHVIMDCCLQEKVFNPYYAYLGQKFCEYDRRFQMTIQFHLWDKLKTLQGLSNHSMSNLAKFLVHLFATKALSISVLKVVEFGEMDKIMVKFLRFILLGLLVDHADYTIKDVFHRIATFPKLHVLREGLKLFLHHFILKNKEKYPTGDVNLEQRVKMAEAALKSGETKLRM
ncbi:nucleolar MIF4G domain-containing protein 1-like isoform X2 [Lineus longissimus]|uniref:nucleolar MIF4G domain-containing protein 1-like isoform X2 n=1 Tax=Lineus longissimus TaxID=88925 RepID=UPI00315D2E99